MPRPKKLDRPTRFDVVLPESIAAAVRLELFSELEGKIPHGALSNLTSQLLRDWLISRGVKI